MGGGKGSAGALHKSSLASSPPSLNSRALGSVPAQAWSRREFRSCRIDGASPPHLNEALSPSGCAGLTPPWPFPSCQASGKQRRINLAQVSPAGAPSAPGTL